MISVIFDVDAKAYPYLEGLIAIIFLFGSIALAMMFTMADVLPGTRKEKRLPSK